MDDQFGRNNGGDWNQAHGQQGQPTGAQAGADQGVPSPGAQPPAAMSYNPNVGSDQLREGTGSFEDSSALFPEIKEEVAWFWGALKGPMLKTIALIIGVELLVAVGVELLSVVLHIAEVGPTLFSVLGGLEGLVDFIGGIAVTLLSVSFFRIAHDTRTGFLSEPPGSVRASIDYVKPVLLPVLLATLVSGVAIAFGAAFCLAPGVIAFIALFPVRYIAATHPDQDFSRNMESSIDLGKRYWGALLLLGVGVFVITLGLSLVNMITVAISTTINTAALMNFGSVASAVVLGASNMTADLVGALVAFALFVILWCLEGGVMSTLVRAKKAR